jgi:hypothetical protein
MIRKTCITAALALAAATSATPASAQGIIPAVIGQTIANMSAGMPEDCLDGSKEPTVEQAARFTREAEPAMRAYLALAAAGTDVAPSFVGRSEQHWTLDGNVVQIPAVRDPWASRVTRLELVGLRLGALKVRGRGQWRAFAADGTLLGTYDGLFRRRTHGFKLSSLDLYSAGAARQAPALAGFCYTPGDSEAFLEARARREAERAARRAAREAARAAGADAPGTSRRPVR